MSKHLLSSLAAAVLIAAPALLAQTPGQRETDKTDATKTQDRADPGSKDQARSAEQASGTTQLRNNERQFLMEAAQDSLAEIELGKLAQENGSNSEVKEFGERMVEDHTKALEKLKDTAAEANVTLPSELQAKRKSTHDRLAKLSGEEFDQAYMKHMVQDHKKAVKKFEKTSKNAQNEAVKTYASATLPTLREHSQQAQALHSQMAAKGAASRQKEATQPSDDPTIRRDPTDTRRDPTDIRRDPTDPQRDPTGTPRRTPNPQDPTSTPERP